MLKPTTGKKTWLYTARTLPPSARMMGLYILGSRGSGKSRLSGRLLAFHDFRAGVPQVIIDPLGGTVDNFLDKVFRFLQHVRPEHHHAYWQRIRFIDMSGKEGTITWPLYYKLGHERSLREVAERYLQVILKSNPSLLNAQVQGWPPLHKIGVYVGMALAALNLQITSAESLLRYPEQYLSRLAAAQDQYPELAPVIAFFKDEYLPMRPVDRSRLTNPFMDKIFPFTGLDPHLTLMFGGNTPGIDWHEVEEKRLTVLIDFRHEQDPEMRRFKLLWVVSHLLEHIKLRGRSPRPLAVLIDEISALTQKVFSGDNPLASELDAFINQYMRGHNIWFSCIHQELYQIDEQFRNTLLSLGTYIIGGTSSMESARLLADALFLRDPYWVKRFRPVYGRVQPRDPLAVIAEDPEFMPLLEQRELFAQRIKRLGLFEFLLRPALGEGSISSAVLPLSIRTVDRNPSTGEYLFPDQERMARLRSLLAARSARPLERLLTEQTATSGQGAPQEPPDSGTLPAPYCIDEPINRRELLD